MNKIKVFMLNDLFCVAGILSATVTSGQGCMRYWHTLVVIR